MPYFMCRRAPAERRPEGPPPPPPPDDRPHRPPRDGGRALSPPLQPSHTPVRPAPPDPVLSPRPTAGGGALPAPAFPGTLPPTPPPRAEGRGSDGKLGAKRARAHVRGTGEAKRGRESRTDGRRRRGGGGGRGAGDSPEARKAWGGAWRPARQAQSGGRPTTGRGRPAQGRRREAAGQGRRTRDGEPPPVTPHSPPDATGGSAPRGPRPLTGGRQSWPAPRA